MLRFAALLIRPVALQSFAPDPYCVQDFRMSCIKSIAWAVLERLPTRLSALLLGLSGRDEASGLAVKNGRYVLAMRLALRPILASAKRGAWSGVLLIGGPPRIGKSTVSLMVGETLGAGQVVHLDKYREIWGTAPEVQRSLLKQDFLDKLCRNGRSLIVEGVDLVTEDRVFRPAGKLQYSALPLLRFDRASGVTCVVLGAAGDEPYARFNGMLSGAQSAHCWAVSQFGTPQLLRLAQEVVQASKALRDELQGSCVHYFNVPAATFNASTASIAEQIAHIAAKPAQAETFWTIQWFDQKLRGSSRIDPLASVAKVAVAATGNEDRNV